MCKFLLTFYLRQTCTFIFIEHAEKMTHQTNVKDNGKYILPSLGSALTSEIYRTLNEQQIQV